MGEIVVVVEDIEDIGGDVVDGFGGVDEPSPVLLLVHPNVPMNDNISVTAISRLRCVFPLLRCVPHPETISMLSIKTKVACVAC